MPSSIPADGLSSTGMPGWALPWKDTSRVRIGGTDPSLPGSREVLWVSVYVCTCVADGVWLTLV